MRYQFKSVELRATGPEKTTHDVGEMLLAEGMYTQAQEVFWIIAFGPELGLHSVIELGRGDFYSVGVSYPVFLMGMGASGTDRFWAVHNHPSGNVKPTKKDIDLTKRLMVVSNLADLYFEDHMIVGPPRKLYSMLEHGQLVPKKIRTMTVAAQED